MNMHSDRVIKKGWGVSYIKVIVSKFISKWGISIERIVLTNVSDMISSLNMSSLEEDEKSSSFIKIEIFLLFPRAARHPASLPTGGSFLIGSASKQIFDPKLNFLKDNVFSFFF